MNSDILMLFIAEIIFDSRNALLQQSTTFLVVFIVGNLCRLLHHGSLLPYLVEEGVEEAIFEDGITFFDNGIIFVQRAL